MCLSLGPAVLAAVLLVPALGGLAAPVRTYAGLVEGASCGFDAVYSAVRGVPFAPPRQR